MKCDALIVDAGPVGLSAAIRLAQSKNHSLSIVVLEKGITIGTHILSGAL